MRHGLYLRRLRKDLDTWVERGWVAKEHKTDILEHAARGEAASRTPLVTAIMGILLIGGGVIMFFAANWDGMTKLSKLVLLLGGMWAAYGVAYAFLRKEDELEQRMAQAILALGLILFGANIMLVAQTFHISDRAPNGILLWTLGGLAGAWLMRSHLLAFFGLGLATLWTGMETTGLFGGIEPAFAPWPYDIHWPFPFVWAGFMWLAFTNQWPAAARLGIMVMVWWLWVTFSDLIGYGLFSMEGIATDEWHVFGDRLSFLLMANLFLLGRLAEYYPPTRLAALTLRNTALLAGLSFFYLSTLRGDYGLSSGAYGLAGGAGFEISTPGVATAAAVALLVLALGLWWIDSQRPGKEPSTPLPKVTRLALLLAIVVSAGFVPWDFQPHGAALAAYIGVNALFLLAMAGLVQGGYVAGNRVAVNLGLSFFTIWIIALYFDTFFGLMDRSLFFVGAGVLLLGGGYVLQRQRRKLLQRMDEGTGS